MGYHADLMAEINGVTREAQDAYTVASHQKAAAARTGGSHVCMEKCALSRRVPGGTVVSKDNLIQGVDRRGEGGVTAARVSGRRRWGR